MGGLYGAHKLHDGILNHGDTPFHTCWEAAPWAVLAFAASPVDYVRVFNRASGSWDRLGGHYIKYLGSGGAWNVCAQTIAPNEPGPFMNECVAASTTSVLVQLDHAQYLNLAEVEVYRRC